MAERPTTVQACEDLFTRDPDGWYDLEFKAIAEQEAAGVEDDMTCAVCALPIEQHPSYPDELR